MNKRRSPTLKYPNTFRVDLLNTIKNHLLDTHTKQVQKIVDEIALQHRKLTKTLAGFRYKGKVYQHHLVNELFFKLTPLHDDLVQKFEEYITIWKMNKDRQADLNMVLVNVLSEIGNTNDLYALLPDCIHSLLPPRDGIEPTLVQEYIDQFKQENQEQLGLIAIQLVMRSLKG